MVRKETDIYKRLRYDLLSQCLTPLEHILLPPSHMVSLAFGGGVGHSAVIPVRCVKEIITQRNKKKVNGIVGKFNYVNRL